MNIGPHVYVNSTTRVFVAGDILESAVTSAGAIVTDGGYTGDRRRWIYDGGSRFHRVDVDGERPAFRDELPPFLRLLVRDENAR